MLPSEIFWHHISKVCRNGETEPLLQPLDNEVFNLQSTVTSREARLDIKARGFWTPGVTAFFDVRVTHLNSRSNQGEAHSYDLQRVRKRKERSYNQRVMELLHHFCLAQTGTWDSTARTF